ncbi:MAG: hypothetical protein JRI23_26975 [Deltaproteobacteria bacterium]|jgi:hypothetical protein|nr:hypothetical protein [Deltaproteobacteria bacterium]MBW2535715.1 hypothetical protein [Deltaproteobacteria bacterium]
MAHITKVLHRISHWLHLSFGPVLPVDHTLDNVHISDRDIAEDLAYGRD